MNFKENKYNILGFIAGAHSCGAAFIPKDKDVIVIEEERMNRIKVWKDYENDFDRYPFDSITCLIDRHGLDLNEVDFFTSFISYEDSCEIFLQAFGFELPFHKFVRTDHHQCHAIASYLFSDFKEDTLVFCADASGSNGYSSKTYIGSNGTIKFVDGITTKRKSLGHFYAALTEIIGFKRLKDEGKVVGLSGHGTFWDELYRVWDDVIKIEDTHTNEDKHDVELGGVYLDMYTSFFKMVGSKYWKAKHTIQDMAYTGQLLFENKVLHILCNIHNNFPHIKKLALSGGIFANVKLNKRINELDLFDEVFVLPPMGDEGLALGSALVTLKSLNKDIRPFRLDNVYFGNTYTENEIKEAADEVLGDYEFISFIDSNYIANLLINKKIIGLYQGASEHGARALGNRSIIADATHPDTYDILNNKLQRNDYMPFAPAVLEQDANLIFDIQKSPYTFEFMTMLVDTKEEYRDKIPTCVHPVDKTARIQIVTRNSNKMFYDILRAYKNVSGIGCLVNTSFNIHNEPIVERPTEAMTHLKNGIIDYLVTPNGIYSIAS
jgi:carbamoyltransferase